MTAYVPPKVARWLTKEQRELMDELVRLLAQTP